MFDKREQTSKLETIIKLVVILVITFFVFVSPFWLYHTYENQGIIMYLVALFLLSPFVFFTYKKLIYFRTNEISNTFKSPNTYLGLIMVFNAYVFFTIGFNTLIVTLWLGMF